MTEQEPTITERKPYHPPQVEEYGSLLTMTLGGSGKNTDTQGGSGPV